MIENNTFLNIEKEYQFIFKKLCGTVSENDNTDIKKNKKDFAFPTQWELFIWSAILGYLDGNPAKIAKKHPLFRWGLVKHNHVNMLLVFVINSLQSFDILNDKDGLRQNIEEHANRGLIILNKELAENPIKYNDLESLIHEIQMRVKNK